MNLRFSLGLAFYFDGGGGPQNMFHLFTIHNDHTPGKKPIVPAVLICRKTDCSAAVPHRVLIHQAAPYVSTASRSREWSTTPDARPTEIEHTIAGSLAGPARFLPEYFRIQASLPIVWPRPGCVDLFLDASSRYVRISALWFHRKTGIESL